MGVTGTWPSRSRKRVKDARGIIAVDCANERADAIGRQLMLTVKPCEHLKPACGAAFALYFTAPSNMELNRNLNVPHVCARCWVRKPINTTRPLPRLTSTSADLPAIYCGPISQPE